MIYAMQFDDDDACIFVDSGFIVSAANGCVCCDLLSFEWTIHRVESGQAAHSR